MDGALALQEDELTALDSIYPGLVKSNRSQDGYTLSLSIPITLAGATLTQLTVLRTTTPLSAELRLTHLPPLLARVALPPTYPLSEPPRVVSLRAPLSDASGAWLNRRVLTLAQERLRQLWEEEASSGDGVGVLWSWWDWLGNGHFLEDAGLLVDHTLTLSTPPHLPPSTFHLLLKAHDTAIARADFEGTAFPCAVCFENRKGKKSVQLPKCGCIFCHSCLSSFWALAITEGTLENVACPSIGCVKARAADKVDHTAGAFAEQRADGIGPDIVASVVGQEMADRWQMLSEKRLVDQNPEYTFCARKTCQAAVPPDRPAAGAVAAPRAQAKVIRLDIRRPDAENNDDEPTFRHHLNSEDVNTDWDNCRTCPKCKYTFCLVCRAVWHGVHTPCEFNDIEAVVKEYLDGDADIRAAMEKRLGPRGSEALHALIREHEREALFRQWVSNNAAKCPRCGASIQKSEGCNHMKCPFCMAHFCYRCGTEINAKDPYKHFNESNTTTNCAGRLFDYDPEEDGGWIPMPMEVIDAIDDP
ncbi:hypothetical protein CspeluHIS016_0114610 [Cutaneotrichosporon spelunceum]|uniref:RBR-type E3 ubiquitin transferase n=1 Tax=Cutaneotrichosporon spelunceum TaxID=1672016 RepID=A0AAD3Y9D3_9TREE|nr:hypothetical protein CspeluHIS016_0114610 [Cutaneotrichosporon spelunceum]